jgi:ribosomal-protein-alanine N-acetyltransferase
MERHESSGVSFDGPGVEHVRTARMDGEPLGPEHTDWLARLVGDPLVGATLGGVRTRREAAEMAAASAAHWQRHGFGYWIWLDRASGDHVARGGLSRAQVEGEEVVEIGWAVMPDRWAEGIASELGAASIAAAGELGIPEVVAFTLPANVGSRRVMEKLGMTYDRVFVHGPWGPHVLFSIRTDAASGNR